MPLLALGGSYGRIEPCVASVGRYRCVRAGCDGRIGESDVFSGGIRNVRQEHGVPDTPGIS